MPTYIFYHFKDQLREFNIKSAHPVNVLIKAQQKNQEQQVSNQRKSIVKDREENIRIAVKKITIEPIQKMEDEKL